MASSPNPPLIPLISTLLVSDLPVRIASPDDDSVPVLGTRSLARSASPTTPAVFSTTLVSPLKTATLGPQFPSRSRSGTYSRGGSSVRNAKSKARIWPTTSPSEIQSTTLSPSISSGGGSYDFSDIGYGPCSPSSSDYLTPPQFQADFEKRPYKARRQSSDSLNMVRKRKRAEILPHDETQISTRRHRRDYIHHYGRGNTHEPNTEHWCLQGCCVTPMAATGTKELSHTHFGRYRPLMSIRGNADICGRGFPHLRSDPVPPVVTRRWSSVEVGSHQIYLQSTLPVQLAVSTPIRLIQDPEFAPHRMSRPYRGSTFTPGAIDHDFIRTVREKLTVRRVASIHLQTPATITLRRASGLIGTGGSTVTELLAPANVPETGGSNPHAYPTSEADRETDAAYLITRQEVDSITELIEANLRRNHQAHNRVSTYPPATPPTSKGMRSPNFTLKEMLSKTPSTAQSSDTITPLQPTHSRTQDNLDYLEATSTPKARTRALSTRLSSQEATHEIIWEAGPRSSCQKCSRDSFSSLDDLKRSTTSNSESQPETACITPPPRITKPIDSLPLDRKSDAFDPNNARASINEWSWRLPHAEIPVTVISSDLVAKDRTPALKVPAGVNSKIPIRLSASPSDVPRASARGKGRSSAKPAALKPEMEDVVSFPPLRSRASTKDWCSPLPEIVSSPEQPLSRWSLYKERIDSIRVEPISLPFQKPTMSCFFKTPESLLSTIEFDPDPNLRRRSTIKAHPQSPARVGSQSAMGSSIGASSGERRKSSAKPALQRVQTIDNIHKGKRAGTWTRNRPPSVCPPPKTPSPTEMGEESDNSIPTLRSSKAEGQEGSSSKNLKPIKGPPLPKVDRAGIYEKITGTLKSALRMDAEGCLDECPPKHECDDCAKDPRNPSVDWIG